MTDLDAIRPVHYPDPDHGGHRCHYDGSPWPCHTATVLAALDAYLKDAIDPADFDGAVWTANAAIERERRLRAHFATAAGISYDLWLAVATEDELATTPEGE